MELLPRIAHGLRSHPSFEAIEDSDYQIVHRLDKECSGLMIVSRLVWCLTLWVLCLSLATEFVVFGGSNPAGRVGQVLIVSRSIAAILQYKLFRR